MNQALITLTTDFGLADPYVAAMKGVILSINPDVRIADLSHEIGAHDVLHGAIFLLGAISYFPLEALHVVVVDPGVGTDRALLYAECGPHRLLLPDNGLLTLLAERHPPRVLIRLTNRRFFRESVSATFHGRDVLAPVAAHLIAGLDPTELGPIAAEWVRLPLGVPHRDGDRLSGEVIHVDHFGNLITNIALELPEQLDQLRVHVGSQILPLVRTYGDAPPGQAVGLVSSAGLVEVAVVRGRACVALQLGVGAAVALSGLPPD